jgi:hypothetical protein
MNENQLAQLRSDTYIKLANAKSDKDRKYYKKILHVIDSLKKLAYDLREISRIGNSL